MAISVGEGGKTIPRPNGKGCYGEFMRVGVEGGDRGTRAVYFTWPRDGTQFPRIAVSLFTIWTTREALCIAGPVRTLEFK